MSETAPTYTNPYETEPVDPAQVVIDAKDDLRQAAHSAGASMDQFADKGTDGRAGAYELDVLITQMQVEGRTDLSAYEQQFVDHMHLEVAYEKARANVDFEAFGKSTKGVPKGTMDTPEIAARNNIAGIKAELFKERKALNKDTDQAAIDRINDKIAVLNEFLKLPSEDRTGGDGSVERNFMHASHEAEHVTGPRAEATKGIAEEMSDRLEDYDARTVLRVQAYEIIADYYPGTPDTSPIPDVAPDVDIDDAADPADPADATPAPTGPRAETAEETKLRIELENDEFNDLRDQIAKQRTSAGKRFKDLFGQDDNPDRLALEQQYKEMSKYMAERNNPILRDPTAPADLKAAAAAKFVLTEQAEMRKLYKEKLENTSVAKISKWIGKHRFLVIGGLTVLAPLTMGTSLTMGAALAGGLLAGSKVDSMMRGRGIGDKSGVSMKELKNRIQASGGDFEVGHDFAKADFEEEAKKEMRNRTIAVGGAAAAATVFSSVNMGGFFNGLDHPMQYVKGASILAILFGLAKPEKKKTNAKH